LILNHTKTRLKKISIFKEETNLKIDIKLYVIKGMDNASLNSKLLFNLTSSIRVTVTLVLSRRLTFKWLIFLYEKKLLRE